MNRPLLASAVLALLLTLAHGVGGHVTNLRRLATGPLRDGEKLELHATWHLYTWQLGLSALTLLAILAGVVPASPPLHAYLALTFLGGSLVVVALALRRGARELLLHPQWVFLALLGALAWWSR